MKRASVYKFHYRNLKLKLDLQSQKTIFLINSITISLNIQLDKFGYHAVWETSVLASFESESLSYSTSNSLLQKSSSLTIVKVTISTGIDITFQAGLKKLRAITLYSGFTPDCGYDNSTVIFIGDMFWANTKCLGKFWLHKKTFQSLGKSDNQCLQCGSV